MKNMRNFKSVKIGALAVFTLILITMAYFSTIAEQPGSINDPLVTRDFVDGRISQLSDEIDILRDIIASLSPQSLPSATASPSETQHALPSELSEFFEEITDYMDATFNARLEEALRNLHIHIPGPGHYPIEPRVVIFDVLHLQAGQTVTFEAGTEFILRGGSATAITGPYNGIPDVTAAADVMNGQNIGLNHLMMIPFTDGRGIRLQAESWIMVRGGYSVG